MIILTILAFIFVGSAIAICAIQANKINTSYTRTDEEEIDDINQREAEKRAELLAKGGTIK